MKDYLKELSKNHTIAAVGGSDLIKIKEQLIDGNSLKFTQKLLNKI
jgi:hypothetical protein